VDLFEGLDKATRGAGGEWEPIKILKENLSSVPNQIQLSSLLSWQRPHSYG
jgi:hypothetical protein